MVSRHITPRTVVTLTSGWTCSWRDKISKLRSSLLSEGGVGQNGWGSLLMKEILCDLPKGLVDIDDHLWARKISSPVHPFLSAMRCPSPFTRVHEYSFIQRRCLSPYIYQNVQRRWSAPSCHVNDVAGTGPSPFRVSTISGEYSVTERDDLFGRSSVYNRFVCRSYHQSSTYK